MKTSLLKAIDQSDKELTLRLQKAQNEAKAKGRLGLVKFFESFLSYLKKREEQMSQVAVQFENLLSWARSAQQMIAQLNTQIAQLQQNQLDPTDLATLTDVESFLQTNPAPTTSSAPLSGSGSTPASAVGQVQETTPVVPQAP